MPYILYLPRAERRRDRDVLLPKVVGQQPRHPGGPAMSLGDDRHILEV